jgi:hypothetical protein
MASPRDNRQTRADKIVPNIPPELPEMPPKTAAELEAAAEVTAMLIRATAALRQRNLNTAVSLAQQAAAGHGPLVEHFHELGRRFPHLLEPKGKPSLRVIDGGGE